MIINKIKYQIESVIEKVVKRCLDKKFKKAFPHHDSAGKLKKAGGGRAIYKSGGAVMTGKKVGCQIK